MKTLIMEPAAAMPGLPARRPRKTHVLLAAVSGGAIGACLGGLVVVVQSALTNVSATWSAGALLAGAGVLVGGFIGAMMTRNLG